MSQSPELIFLVSLKFLVYLLSCNTAGLYGLVTYAMYAIGVEMTMGVMVTFEHFPCLSTSFSFMNVLLAF